MLKWNSGKKERPSVFVLMVFVIIVQMPLMKKKYRTFVIQCDNSQHIDFRFNRWKITSDFEEHEDGVALGKMVFGLYSHVDMAINFDAISRVIKIDDSSYILELKDERSRVFC